MKNLFRKYPFLAHPAFLLALYVIVFAAVTLHRLLMVDDAFNNFDIFRYSFFNLITGNDLYILHPDQYFDLYKYSPTFALTMAPFWWIPKLPGLFIWNFLNALLPLYAIQRLKISGYAKAFISYFILIELITSVQNSQSNGLMAGLMILSFVFLEEKKPALSVLMICLGFYVKLFAALAALLMLFYDRKPRFILSGALFVITLGVLPVAVTGIEGLTMQYKSWLHLLGNDPAHALNYSIMTFAERALHVHLSDSLYLIGGLILLSLPLLRQAHYNSYQWRITYLATILIWVVIFNHKAESPTFVIAMAGAALWYSVAEKNTFRLILILFVFLLTGLSATDLFPPFIRNEIIRPYALKALPCIVLFFVMIADLWKGKFSPERRLYN
ncbi:MAG: glycosyltransferase family 87 protein [Bacteroidia bacterium]